MFRFKIDKLFLKSKVRTILSLFFGLLISCTTSEQKSKNEVLVYCAASLSDVISEIIADYEANSDVVVKINLASSGTLARQIEMGAIPGIYISANHSWLDYIDAKGLIEPDTKIAIAKNSLVLIAPFNSEIIPFKYHNGLRLPDIFEGRLSIGDPAHVPAGDYTVDLLKNLECLEILENRFLPAKDVRSALMVVEMGEAEIGIVYKTDAQKSDKVKVLTEFPDSLYKPITYNMAITKGRINDQTLQLYNYIVSGNSISIWQKHGFKIRD